MNVPARSSRSIPPRGFTLVELTVVIGIIMVLLAILIPMTARVRDAANTARCLSNLRQIGSALISYSADHHGCLVPGDYISLIDQWPIPGGGNWADILVDGGYISAPQGDYPADKLYAEFEDGAINRDTILSCPNGQDENAAADMPSSQTDARGSFYFVRGSDTTHKAVYTWYGINCIPRPDWQALTDAQRRSVPFNFLPDFSSGSADYSVTRYAKLKSNLVLIYDGVWCFNGDPARINARHGGRKFTNILFVDSHCESQLTSTLPNENWYLH